MKKRKISNFKLILGIILIIGIVFILSSFCNIWDFLLNLAPLIILVLAVITFIIRSKTLIKLNVSNEEKNKQKKSSVVKLIIWIFISVFLWFGVRTNNSKYGTYVDKPIIYLYPDSDMHVSVKLGNKDMLTVSYPEYKDGWNIFAKTNGDLIEADTNKNLYALYYEAKNKYNFSVLSEGFVVKGKDTSKFLEDKLTILGLNYKEREEFIIYWLPRLQKNKYNYIYFATMDEIDRNMPLLVSPIPDNVIRVLMIYKGLSKPIDVNPQKLVTPDRNGFVVVEWGGTEIK